MKKEVLAVKAPKSYLIAPLAFMIIGLLSGFSIIFFQNDHILIKILCSAPLFVLGLFGAYLSFGYIFTPKIMLYYDEENIYLGFSKMIGERYGWDTKILEVGGGYYPIFSKYIDDAQTKNGLGKITVFDPVLVTNKLGTVNLQKKEFSHDIDVSDFDLLVGICPCEATTEIIKSAVVNKKEFFIAMCGCTHFPMYDMPWFYNPSYLYPMWVEEVVALAKEQEDDGFEVIQETVDNFPYPIISSKIKK